jgi:hypothetical protein
VTPAPEKNPRHGGAGLNTIGYSEKRNETRLLFLFALIVLFPHGAGNGYAEYDGKDIIKNALEAVRPGLILSGFSS